MRSLCPTIASRMYTVSTFGSSNTSDDALCACLTAVRLRKNWRAWLK